MMSNKDLWLEVLSRLRPTIKKAHFLTWFQNTAILSLGEDVMVVGVPNAFAESWIALKYGIKILQAVQELNPQVKVVKYEVSNQVLVAENGLGVDVKKLILDKEDNKTVRKVRNQNEIYVSKGTGLPMVTSELLNGRYTLDNFVVGNDNRLPHAASTAVANMPGGIYNPLYIYGNVGLGKTHLLQAIGRSVLKNSPDKVVKYITAEKFVTEVVQAIGGRFMKKFKDQYRNVDVLLVDDVQFFARKNSSQQEFFHTFNELYNLNKQIVIASDRPPSELDDLDERLKSRFAMGMVVELLFPDFETRVAILQQKCKESQVIIDPEVLSFIANNVHNSVRELEGVLRQAIAESQLANRVPSIRSVAEIIKRLNKAQKIIGYDIEAKRASFVAQSSGDVMNAVADFYKIGLDDLMGSSRKKEVIVPRQICMYLIKNELGDSYEKIGFGFGGRNHTTVMHACNKMEEMLRNDLRLVREMNSIKKVLGL